MNNVWIPSEVMSKMKVSPEALRVELATFFYAEQIMTLGQAKRFAGMDQIAFQKELTKREIYLHLRFEDVLQDVKNLQSL